jgi:threonine aldolase
VTLIENRIDLYSDTQTRPSDAMRRAMAEAPVGDEQRGEDPTVNRLCIMVAELLGKEAAMFLPSGTMCNEIAILVHCRPGDEIIADGTAHIIIAEGGGPAAFAGAMLRTLDGVRGIYQPAQVEAAIRDDGRYSPNSRMVVVEQTSNFGGGTIWPLATIEAVGEATRRHGLAYHMDGARLFNAVVSSGVTALDYAAPFDSLWVDLSKGLGCPVGAVLAGSKAFIDKAWRWKQRMGGAMRQAGIIAAAGVYALEHNVERLADDKPTRAASPIGSPSCRVSPSIPKRWRPISSSSMSPGPACQPPRSPSAWPVTVCASAPWGKPVCARSPIST